MTALLLAIIPIVLGALFAGQIALTRTGRLRMDILVNLDLLGRLPAEHPNRAVLEPRTGSWWACWPAGSSDATGRPRRPGSLAGFSLGVLAGVAAVVLVFAGFGALLATGVIPSNSDPPEPGDGWAAVVFFLLIAAGCIVAAVRTARQQLREHPSQPQQQPAKAPQPAEAG